MEVVGGEVVSGVVVGGRGGGGGRGRWSGRDRQTLSGAQKPQSEPKKPQTLQIPKFENFSPPPHPSPPLVVLGGAWDLLQP